MIRLKTNDILILANNTFTIIEKKSIKTAKFMIQKQACFLLQISIKFNYTQIQFIPNRNITLS